MRTQEAASGGAKRFIWLALSLAVVSLTARAAGPPEAALLSITETRSAESPVTEPTITDTEPAVTQPSIVQAMSPPSLAFARYIESLGRDTRPAEWQTVTVEIEASLPGLAKQGRLRAIRRTSPSGSTEYRVLHVEGDPMVKEQVIARYLTAEKQAEATPKASVAVSPANYKFRYVGSIASSGTLVYVYQVTPKKKRAGLIEGQLWIDAGTGLPVHQGGHLVKKPSVFIRRVELVRNTQLHDGVPSLETTHLAIDARFVGRAELTIREHPYTDSNQVIAALNSGTGVRP